MTSIGIDYTIARMSGEIKKVQEQVLEEQTVNPGGMIELDTQFGKIQIIGTERGFVVRRPGASTLPDIPYTNGESLTLNQKGQPSIKISAVAPVDWKASDLLDPMV